MASERIESADVTAIVPTSLDVAVFIDTANLIVEETLLDQGYSFSRLRQIELYLACHITALAEEGGGLVRSSIGDAADSWANVYGSGLKSTRWGQMALSLDSSGKLAAASSTKLNALFDVPVPAVRSSSSGT